MFKENQEFIVKCCFNIILLGNYFLNLFVNYVTKSQIKFDYIVHKKYSLYKVMFKAKIFNSSIIPTVSGYYINKNK